MKKLFFIFILVLTLLPWPSLAQTESKVNLYLFYGNGCPHCAKEEAFLDDLMQDNDYKDKINLETYEVWYDSDNAKLMSKVAQALNVEASGVPMTIVGNKAVIGFYSAQTTGEDIKNLIDEALQNSCTDFVASVQSGNPNPEAVTCQQEKPRDSVIDVPIFGQVDTKDISLPLLTLIIGGLDGFNPCAMWILLFLISLLLNMQNRRRMWILGISFIVASAIVYYLFLAAWLNLFLFLGVVFWIRAAVAAVAIFSGVYHLKDYFSKKTTCKVTDNNKRKKTFGKLKTIVTQDKFWLALGGVIILAAAVNLVELVCSAGLPAVYTHILSASNLATWQYYLYLVFYIIIFMLDDIIVFIIAMTSLKMARINTKYSRVAGLIGGIVMLLIGILLVFKPGWIMFG